MYLCSLPGPWGPAFEALGTGPRPHQLFLAQNHGPQAGTLGEAQLSSPVPYTAGVKAQKSLWISPPLYR